MRLHSTVVIVAFALAVLACGCGHRVTFPAEPLALADVRAGVHRAYDTDGDKHPDVTLMVDQAGRVTHIRDTAGTFDVGAAGEGTPHLTIILDGFGYDLVRDYYAAGNLRVFHPPARVTSVYPSMSDPNIQDLLGLGPVPGIEAEYFDKTSGKVVGGVNAYMAGSNQPYNTLMDYRATTLVDAIGYSAPWLSFVQEVDGVKKAFDRNLKAGKGQTLTYLVSSAGVSTKFGADGQRRALRRVQQLVNQLMVETRGRIRITMMSDHGHSYTPPKSLDLDKQLKKTGWRMTRSLKSDYDVVAVKFGVVTYAALNTLKPAELARDAAKIPGVELASYRQGETVIVLGRDASRAVIESKDGQYRYRPVKGDPLHLNSLEAYRRLAGDGQAFLDADELLTATATHVYPAPLQRLWRAHNGLVTHPPDVLLSLDNEHYYGAGSFAGFVTIVSTHGNLTYRNSTAFLMSTMGPLPPVLRSGDVPARIADLLGERWPAANPDAPGPAAPSAATTQPTTAPVDEKQ